MKRLKQLKGNIRYFVMAIAAALLLMFFCGMLSMYASLHSSSLYLDNYSDYIPNSVDIKNDDYIRYYNAFMKSFSDDAALEETFTFNGIEQPVFTDSDKALIRSLRTPYVALFVSSIVGLAVVLLLFIYAAKTRGRMGVGFMASFTFFMLLMLFLSSIVVMMFASLDFPPFAEKILSAMGGSAYPSDGNLSVLFNIDCQENFFVAWRRNTLCFGLISAILLFFLSRIDIIKKDMSDDYMYQ